MNMLVFLKWSTVMEWAASEMQTADLGDERLNKRLFSLLNTLGNSPETSIPAACKGRAETKAAYRFFDNDNMISEKLLARHLEASLERIKQQKVVLLVQDAILIQ